MKKRILILSFGLLLMPVAKSQLLRKHYEPSTAVVTGEVVRSWDADLGAEWRADTPNVRRDLRVRLILLRVTNWFKGSGGQEIVVGLPREMTSIANWPGGVQYQISEGSKALWCLQSPTAGDNFRIEKYPAFGGADYMWSAPGASYAPVDRSSHPSVIQLETVPAIEFTNPMIGLLELMGRNAALNTAQKSQYVSWIEDLSPLEIYSRGYGRNLEGAELQEFYTWYDQRLPLYLPPNTTANRMAAAAIRLCWGDPGADATFAQLYRSSPLSLLGRFPRITAESAISLLDMLPIDAARMTFRALQSRIQDRDAITRAGIGRFDETHYLDAAILECLSHLWNRPDLNPQEGAGIAEDLESRKQLARELLGN